MARARFNLDPLFAHRVGRALIPVAAARRLLSGQYLDPARRKPIAYRVLQMWRWRKPN